MHIVLVASTMAAGAEWKKLRPDLGITMIATPLSNGYRGARVGRVYVAPDAHGDRFHRVLAVMKAALRRAGRSPDDDLCLLAAADRA